MSILNRAKSHFESLGVQSLEIEEWPDDSGKPTIIYWNPITLAEKKRLFERGYTDNFDGVLEDKALAHIAFAGPGVAIQKARDGVRELLSRIGKYQLEEQIALATNAVMDDLNEVNWNRLSSLRAALVSVNGGSNLEDPV